MVEPDWLLKTWNRHLQSGLRPITLLRMVPLRQILIGYNTLSDWLQDFGHPQSCPNFQTPSILFPYLGMLKPHTLNSHISGTVWATELRFGISIKREIAHQPMASAYSPPRRWGGNRHKRCTMKTSKRCKWTYAKTLVKIVPTQCSHYIKWILHNEATFT